MYAEGKWKPCSHLPKEPSVPHIYMCAQLCPTLCDPTDCNPPDSSVHGIFQARTLELPFPTPGDLPDPAIEPVSLTSPALGGSCFITVPPRKLHFILSPSLYIFLSPCSDAASKVLISLACFNSRFKQMKPIPRRP